MISDHLISKWQTRACCIKHSIVFNSISIKKLVNFFMADKSELAAFYGSLVKKKVEPLVFSAWIKKISRKKKEQSRFMVATEAALYLAKKAVIGKGLKISKIYPWVTISEIVIAAPDIVKMTFGSQKISLYVDQLEQISKSLSSFLSGYFPESYRYTFTSHFATDATYSIPLKRYLPSLYVSQCHALEAPINEQFFTFLSKESARKTDMLDLTEIDVDKKTAAAFVPVLGMVRTIAGLKVNGSNFAGVLKNLASVIIENPTVTKLVIENVDKFRHYTDFLEAIDKSHVISLELIDFSLNDERFEQLMALNRLSSMQHLALDKCKLSTATIELMCKNQGKFKSMSTLAIRNNKGIFNKVLVKSVLNLCCQQSISNLQLTKLGFKIDWLFLYLSNLVFLAKLDISGNICDEHLKSLPLPASLKTFDMSQVQWKPFSLIQMLTERPFNEGTELNFTGAILSHSDWNAFYDQINQVQQPGLQIAKLDWSENPLDTRFLAFCSTLTNLKWLGLNRCEYSDDKIRPILNGLEQLVRQRRLEGFHMRGTKKRQHKVIITSLLPTFTELKCLVDLDVSDNRIGNNGLNLLQKLVAESENLRCLSFDGSRPSKVPSLSKLLQQLSASESVIRVPLPKNDINAVLAKAPAMKETLRQVWDDLREKIDLRRASTPCDETNLHTFTERTAFPTTNLPLTTIGDTMDMTLSASWNVDINLPFNNGFQEWEELRQRYSLTKISGIDVS